MKIGILTHPLGTNYGGLLQNFALQKVLVDLGHSPVTLDYIHHDSTKVKIFSVAKRLVRNLAGERVPVRVWPTGREAKIISQYSDIFIKSHINTTRQVDFSELSKLKDEHFDALVVGSDQVWRGDRGHVERYFFSDFTDVAVPKIAYAASMGVDFWSFSDADTRRCKELAKGFRAISVREDSAAKLCKEHLDIDALCVLDPTLMVDKKTYEALTDSIPACGKHQMMVYILDKSREKMETVEKAADYLGLEPHTVMADAHFYEVGPKHLSRCVFPPVESWIAGFRDAQFVVTDSFHGMVFSVIFNKPFVVIANNRRGRGRFLSFLGLLGLQDRLVDKWDEASKILNIPIDYNAVNQVVRQNQTSSLEFLKENLK